MPSKPRHLLSGRDMAYSIVPLVLICLLLAGASRACSFSPGGPETAPPIEVDAAASLSASARTVDFPLRLPDLPGGWTANSASQNTLPGASGGTTIATGWISPSGRYLRLVQSDASVDALRANELRADDSSANDSSANDSAAGSPAPTSTEDLAGTSWSVYTARDSEPGWTADLGEVRLLITGSGSEDEFRALALATTTTDPLPGGA